MLDAEHNDICVRFKVPRERCLWASDCLVCGQDNHRSCRDSYRHQQTYLLSRQSRPALVPTLPIGRSFLGGKAAKT